MFSWAKELLSPTVQTGKPVSADSSRRKSKDAEGEVTEDGFVCIGKSSFYQSPELPALPHNYNFNAPNQHQSPEQSQMAPYPTGPATLYPLLPQQPPTGGLNVAGDNHEFVRRIPFNVRGGGSKSVGPGGGFRQQKPHEIYLTQFRSQSRERYEYDFSFERGVIREMNQLPSGCY